MSTALERECVCANRYNYTMERLRQDCVNERNGVVAFFLVLIANYYDLKCMELS